MTPLMLPFVQLILLALGLIANLCLFLSLKREVRRQSLQQRAALEMLSSRLEKAAHADPVAPTLSPRAPLDPTCRLQMVERLIAGQPPSQVAEAFGIPLTEVELLLRIQQLASSRVTRE